MREPKIITENEFLRAPESHCNLYVFDAVVVGSGAAGLNAARRLKKEGVSRVAVVTEGTDLSTSRNTGSDKQTYYKLSLSGDSPDSPFEMAKALYGGKATDGDVVLAEAAGSVTAFMELVGLGVDFPTDRYGEYVGYRTDHDPRPRATSVGPLTSRIMTEKLEEAVRKTDVRFFERYKVTKILKGTDGTVCGLIALPLSGKPVPLIINTKNIILATGGPACVYADRVYPESHLGSTGLAAEAGARLKNMTEWQFGLASLSPRWNVSGSYMQVLPRFVSAGSDGKEHEFLSEYFGSTENALAAIFRKGYEWPFDSKKARTGSSLIDLLVYREKADFGRRVYLDFTENPDRVPEINYAALPEDARSYLEKAGVCFGCPADRLIAMNAPAYELYLGKGVDLKKDRLEIALCAQHCNGGVDVDVWWQSSVEGLFAVGEVAGTHGVYRPGGSALNSGQVGSRRAALYISEKKRFIPSDVPDDEFLTVAFAALLECKKTVARCLNNTGNAEDIAREVSVLMSGVCGAVRRSEAAEEAYRYVSELLSGYEERIGISDLSEAPLLFSVRDLLVSARTVLFAVTDMFRRGGLSRGSSITVGVGTPPYGFTEDYAFTECDGRFDAYVQDVFLEGGEMKSILRETRPIPEAGGFFENVWKGYRENRNVR